MGFLTVNPQMRVLGVMFMREQRWSKMPDYDFICDCGHAFTRTFAMNELHSANCDKCGQVANKVYVAAAVHFKGTGWGKD